MTSNNFYNQNFGSTSVITNESGSVVEETFYDPYGAILSGGNESRFDYEGKEFSEVTEDYDYRFRKYKPEIGIFTQPEQLFPSLYDPQQLNRYRFERNNPYKYVDKDGQSPHLAVAGISAGVISLAVGGYTYYKTGDLSKSLWAGGIAGVGTFASVATLGFASTTSVAGGGLRYVGTSALAEGGILGGIGAGESIANQRLVQERGFNELSWLDVGVSASSNVLLGRLWQGSELPFVVSRQAGQFFPSTYNYALGREAISQTAISSYTQITSGYIINQANQINTAQQVSSGGIRGCMCIAPSYSGESSSYSGISSGGGMSKSNSSSLWNNIKKSVSNVFRRIFR